MIAGKNREKLKEILIWFSFCNGYPNSLCTAMSNVLSKCVYSMYVLQCQIQNEALNEQLRLKMYRNWMMFVAMIDKMLQSVARFSKTGIFYNLTSFCGFWLLENPAFRMLNSQKVIEAWRTFDKLLTFRSLHLGPLEILYDLARDFNSKYLINSIFIFLYSLKLLELKIEKKPKLVPKSIWNRLIFNKYYL